VECTVDSVFCGGTVYGLFLGFVIGSILMRIRENRRRMGQQNRPLDTFPNAMQSRTTAGDVVRGSRRACLGSIFWVIVFGLAIVGFYMLTNHLLDNGVKSFFNC